MNVGAALVGARGHGAGRIVGDHKGRPYGP